MSTHLTHTHVGQPVSAVFATVVAINHAHTYAYTERKFGCGRVHRPKHDAAGRGVGH